VSSMKHYKQNRRFYDISLACLYNLLKKHYSVKHVIDRENEGSPVATTYIYLNVKM